KKLGGLQDRVIQARAVQIHTAKGPVNGVIGINAPHLMLDPADKDKIITWDKLCIDLGTRSREETEKLGIKLLQPITLKKDFFTMNKKYVVSRSLDNRAGVTGLLETFRQIDEKKLKTEVIFVWGVQEEIGLRGARVISNRIPLDYAIPVDTYSTTDSPGLGDFFEPVYLGKGPVLRMVDARVVATPSLGEKLAKVASKNKIPFQYGVTGGSTDGMALQESGAATMPIGIPMRYSHSSVEVIHLDDLSNLTKLLKAAIYTLSG
ncbi:MAG: M20/M25/M40 family metallo-hydrolase, partial [Thermoplasmata archaeon]|nr:M20/M25/M40 family metallo-hydrolase [Thermoplasmata archaeon]